MATIIPNEFPKHRSERIVCEQLRNAPKDWIIRRSIPVPVPNENDREIDFVLLIPELRGQHRGAVICLEVKGGTYTRRRDIPCRDIWYAGHKKKQILSPIVDARDKKFEFLDHLKRTLGTDSGASALVKRLPLESAVAFTDFPITNVDETKVFGRKVITEGRLVEKLTELVQQVSTRKRDSGNRHRFDSFTKKHAEALYDVLTPKEDKHFWSTGSNLRRTDKELLELTEKQYTNINLVQDNDGQIRNRRVLFEGRAGTGKTMIAMEIARRRSEAGDRVAFLCASWTLAIWARSNLGDKMAAVGTVGDVLFQSNETLENLGNQFDQDLLNSLADKRRFYDTFQKNLMDYGVRSADILKRDGKLWDYLIIDELQYFDVPVVLEVLDCALKGGLKEGTWAMFGDFRSQNLRVHEKLLVEAEMACFDGLDIRKDARESLQELTARSQGDQNWTQAAELTINCRNTRQIATASSQIVGLESPDSEEESLAVAGPEPKIRLWSDSRELGAQITEELRELSQNGTNPDEITIVHDRAIGPEGNSLYEEVPYEKVKVKTGTWQLAYLDKTIGTPSLSKRVKNQVNVFSIESFAGMEADVVIAILGQSYANATESNSNEYYSQLFYVAMSRAKTALIVLSHRDHEHLLRRISASVPA